jgi:hypothetical protein
MLDRAAQFRILVPDPIDFMWRYVQETALLFKRDARLDRGLAIYLGSVPLKARPLAQDVFAEWLAAFDMMTWRYYTTRYHGRPKRAAHPLAPRRDAYNPDYVLITTKVARSGPLSLCYAYAPYHELAARRFSVWLHGVHELVILEGRLAEPNRGTIIPTSLVGEAVEAWAESELHPQPPSCKTSPRLVATPR